MFDFTKPSAKIFSHAGKDILVVVTSGCRNPEDRPFQKGDKNGPIGPKMNSYESFLLNTGGACASRTTMEASDLMSDLMPVEAGEMTSWKASHVVVMSTEITQNCGVLGAVAVFYHELGHIVSGHLEEGVKQPSSLEEYILQEQEADAYSALHVGKEYMQAALVGTVKARSVQRTGLEFCAFLDADIPPAIATRARLLALS